jgi:hypothetical protein
MKYRLLMTKSQNLKLNYLNGIHYLIEFKAVKEKYSMIN